mmetsp:Transcript_3387/g.9183  ORF Transcript_3387/g.9183 Transcript_3387/m.9183 type:complete len:276 (+) Transcript_3387:706-1533(+)
MKQSAPGEDQKAGSSDGRGVWSTAGEGSVASTCSRPRLPVARRMRPGRDPTVSRAACAMDALVGGASMASYQVLGGGSTGPCVSLMGSTMNRFCSTWSLTETIQSTTWETYRSSTSTNELTRDPGRRQPNGLNRTTIVRRLSREASRWGSVRYSGLSGATVSAALSSICTDSTPPPASPAAWEGDIRMTYVPSSSWRHVTCTLTWRDRTSLERSHKAPPPPSTVGATVNWATNASASSGTPTFLNPSSPSITGFSGEKSASNTFWGSSRSTQHIM